MLQNEEQAREAMQETFVNYFESYAHGNEPYPSSLLHRIATNVCLNLIRTRTRRPGDSADESGGEELEWIASALNIENWAQSRSFLERLFVGNPQITAEIAVLRHVDGLTHEEIASELELSVCTIRNHLRRLEKEALELRTRETI